MEPSEFLKVVKEHLSLVEDNNDNNKWTIAESPLGGRGLFAVEDIAVGEVLFVDHPLLYGTRCGAVVQQGCTVCCRIDTEECYKCPKCALLICSENCRITETHYKDCCIISNWANKIPIEEVDDIALSKALTSIRALALNDKQKQFMAALEAHQFPRHGNEVRELNKYFDIPEHELDIMLLASCVLDANAFQIANTFGKDEMSMRGLYPVSGLMNHNCVSNTRHSFNKFSQMTVKASKVIPVGSEIFTCYTGMLWGTPARRINLFKTKHFVCKCDRCTDPTERGTLLAALKCLSLDCSGSMVPVDPLNMSSPWKCLCCNLRVPAKSTGAIQCALGSLMGSLNFDSISDLENFLLNRVLIYIPKTNQIVVDLQCRLIWLLGETDGYRWKELPDSRLSLKESLCRGTLRTVAALGAGDAHLRGLLLYHLHATLAERARRSPHLYEELKPEIENTIEQAYTILQGDISAPPDLELRRRYLGVDSDKPQDERLFMLDSS